jgi:hypothetical protein
VRRGATESLRLDSECQDLTGSLHRLCAYVAAESHEPATTTPSVASPLFARLPHFQPLFSHTVPHSLFLTLSP